MSVGSLVLIGWTFDIGVLQSILPGWVAMKGITALSFVLMGRALMKLSAPSSDSSDHAARVCALSAGVLGALCLLEHLSRVSLGIGQFRLREAADAVGAWHPARMEPGTALNFAFLGAGLWLASGARSSGRRLLAALLLGLLTAAIGAAALLPYAIPPFDGVGWDGVTSMAPSTAVLFTALGTGCVLRCLGRSELPWALGRRTTLYFACGMVVILFTGLNTSRVVFRQVAEGRHSAHDRQAQDQALRLAFDLAETQSHTAGLLATGSKMYARSADAARVRSEEDLRGLIQHYEDAPEMKRQTERLGMRIAEALRTLHIRHGRDLLENIIPEVGEIARREDAEALRRELMARRLDLLTVAIVIAGTAAALAMLLAALLRLDTTMTRSRRSESALQASEARFRMVVESAPDAIFVQSAGRFVYLNPAACRLYGASRPEDLLGKDFMGRVAPEYRDKIRERIPTQRETGQPAPLFEQEHLRLDGSRAPVETTAVPIRYQGEDAHLVFIRDTTQRQRAQSVARARLRMIETTDSDAVSLDDCLRLALDEIETQTGSTIGFYHFLKEDQETLSLQAWSTNTLRSMCTAEGKGMHYPVAKAGVWADCVRQRRPVIHNDYAALQHRKGLPRGHAPVMRELVVPVMRGERIAAIIGVGNKPTDYDAADIETVSLLGDFSWGIVERKIAEKALQENDQRLDLALRAASMGVWRWDIQADRRAFDAEVCRLLGLDSAGFAGTAEEFFSAVHPDDRATVHAALARTVDQGAPYETEYRVVWPDGSVHHIAARGRLQCDVQGRRERINGVIWDVTERKESARHQHLAAVILGILNKQTSLADMIGDVLASLKREAGIEAAGVRLRDGDDFPYFRVDGFTPDFLLAENTLTVRDPAGGLCRDQDGNLCLECTCGLVLSGKTDPANPIFTPGGSCWTNDSTPLLDLPAALDPRLHPRNRCIQEGFLSVALIPIRAGRDIVGLLHLNGRKRGCFTLPLIRSLERVCEDLGLAVMRVQAEASLRESDESRRMILMTAMDGFWLVDREGRLLEVNDAYCRMSGYSRDELLRMRIPDLEADEAASDTADHMRRIISSGEDRFESRHRRKDGRIFDVAISVQFKDIEGGQFVVFIHDITARKKSAAALANLQRLESLGVLAGGIAHDFNNIITAVLGNLSLLRGGAAGEAKELVQEALEACGVATGLAHQLLTFAKGGSPVLKVVDLRPLLKQSAGFAARGSNSRCVFELGESPLAANVDKDQIAQVVQNLVINAAQAMPLGGCITVRAESVVLDADGPARYVRVEVRDQGAGIPPEHLGKVFDPYFSTKAKGRGLGLAMCHSIMVKHGGCITAESKPGAGSIFTLTFPAADAAAVIPAKAPEALISGSGRVLILEDEASVSTTLKRMLKSLGYQAEAVPDGQAALDAYRQALEAGRPFTAVILDLTIPDGMGGKEAMSRLAEIDPKAKGIVSSGYSEDPIMSEYPVHGFSGVLKKPYRVEDVSHALRKVIGSERS